MANHVALLRGINVGGRNKLPMADLRACLDAAGFHDSRTYIQSGNVVFDAPEDGEPQMLADRIGASIADAHGLEIGVVVRSAGDFLAVEAAGHPFSHLELEDKLLMVGFCSAEPTAGLTLDPERFDPDRAELSGSEVFLAYPDGSARSRLTVDVLERDLSVAVTVRNWRTVAKIASMLRD